MQSVSSIKNATSSSEALKNASALPGELERYFLNCTHCLTVYFLECNSRKIRSASASFDSDFPPTIDNSKSKTFSVGDFFNNGCRSRCFTAVNGASLLGKVNGLLNTSFGALNGTVKHEFWVFRFPKLVLCSPYNR